MKYKLNIELVPDSCWGENLRSILSKDGWDYIKKITKKKANGACQICGAKTTLLDCHEVWSYDEQKKIQKLENVVAVCKDCHSVIHIGFTQLKGNIERAENHFMKVNNCSYVEFKKALSSANEEHKRRNQISEWKLDLTLLKNYVNQ